MTLIFHYTFCWRESTIFSLVWFTRTYMENIHFKQNVSNLISRGSIPYFLMELECDKLSNGIYISLLNMFKFQYFTTYNCLYSPYNIL